MFVFLADVGPKQEVKACYECKGVEACRPERLSGAEIRTSAVLGASNLYCYTVSEKNYVLLSDWIMSMLCFVYYVEIRP